MKRPIEKLRPVRELPLAILFESDDYIAVSKPAGLAVIPGRDEDDCLLSRLALQIRLPDSGTADPRLRVVHRLDRDTSGVTLFAKHVAAQRHATQQFMAHTARKEYLALTAARVTEDTGEIDAAITVHPTDKKRMVVNKQGKPSVTRWKIEQRFRFGALLRCFPQTGRTHQIRVHLAYRQMPLWIDPLYGSRDPILLSRIKRDYRKSSHEERPLIDRLTLHAERLSITLPNGEPLDLHAALPKDFASTVRQLSKI